MAINGDAVAATANVGLTNGAAAGYAADNENQMRTTGFNTLKSSGTDSTVIVDCEYLRSTVNLKTHFRHVLSVMVSSDFYFFTSVIFTHFIRD